MTAPFIFMRRQVRCIESRQKAMAGVALHVLTGVRGWRSRNTHAEACHVVYNRRAARLFRFRETNGWRYWSERSKSIGDDVLCVVEESAYAGCTRAHIHAELDWKWGADAVSNAVRWLLAGYYISRFYISSADEFRYYAKGF